MGRIYAGHILTANGGYKPDPDKVAAIVEMPVPQHVTEDSWALLTTLQNIWMVCQG